MIIPNFNCYQDNQFVYIEIKAPNSKLQNAEFDLFDNEIIFTSPPYHLRLNLPGSVIATDEISSRLNSDANEFVLKVKKLNENEHFEGLNLISKLLTTPKESDLRKKNLIDVVDEQNEKFELDKFSDDLIGEENDFFDENLELNEFERTTKSIIDTKYKYGFLNSYSDIIEKYQDDLWQLTDIRNPGELSIDERRKARIEKENEDFNEENYFYDQFENDKFIEELIRQSSDWLDNEPLLDLKSNKTSSESNNELINKEWKFTQDEIFRLKNLPRKEFIKLTKEEKTIVLYGLIDVLYGYCYDKRINEGEKIVESAWTIAKLSSTLSCFETFWKIDDLLNACLRRSLCYPLYRNYELSKSILVDVMKVLNNGQVYIVKCLLEIQKMFNEYGEFKYLLNDLFINDYIIAIQYLDKKYFSRLSELIESKLNSMNKERLGFDLVLLDKAAETVILEQIECLNVS